MFFNTYPKRDFKNSSYSLPVTNQHDSLVLQLCQNETNIYRKHFFSTQEMKQTKEAFNKIPTRLFEQKL